MFINHVILAAGSTVSYPVTTLVVNPAAKVFSPADFLDYDRCARIARLIPKPAIPFLERVMYFAQNMSKERGDGFIGYARAYLSYYAKAFHVTVRTIQRWVKILRDAGLIETDSDPLFQLLHIYPQVTPEQVERMKGVHTLGTDGYAPSPAPVNAPMSGESPTASESFFSSSNSGVVSGVVSGVMSAVIKSSDSLDNLHSKIQQQTTTNGRQTDAVVSSTNKARTRNKPDDFLESPVGTLSELESSTVSALEGVGVDTAFAVERVKSLGVSVCREKLDAYRNSKAAETVGWLASSLRAGTKWLHGKTESASPRTTVAPPGEGVRAVRTPPERITTAPKPIPQKTPEEWAAFAAILEDDSAQEPVKAVTGDTLQCPQTASDCPVSAATGTGGATAPYSGKVAPETQKTGGYEAAMATIRRLGNGIGFGLTRPPLSVPSGNRI